MKATRSRRSTPRKVAANSTGVGTSTVQLPVAARSRGAARSGLKGHVSHSVCRWCYEKIALDDLCRVAREMGLVAIDLLHPAEFKTVKKHGLVCSMVFNPMIDGLGGILKSWNRVEHHDRLVQAYEQRIKDTAAAGFERLICFSGNREGLDDEKGLENCVTGLKRILPVAEKHKVTLCMELLNSKVDHPDYQCDHTAWGVEVVKRISSERFKLIYDIYHMQIMEGDICETIKENHKYFDHYHTGGVPGRGEIDETQELNYPRVIRAVIETGYKGYVAQEFVPKRPDALASLWQGVQICDE